MLKVIMLIAIVILIVFRLLFGRKYYIRKQARILERERRQEEEWKRKVAAMELAEAEERARRSISILNRAPIIELTQEEFDALPHADEFQGEANEAFLYFLRNIARFGYLFVCKTDEFVDYGFSVVGHLVPGDNAICDQYGAGLCVPEKFINRYRVSIVKKKSEGYVAPEVISSK